MKTENKYYTPDISEFHIGFECEGLFTDYGHQSWTEISINDSHDLIGMFDTANHLSIYDEFRVKELDQEDIEELGFEKIESRVVHCEVYKKVYNKITYCIFKTNGVISIDFYTHFKNCDEPGIAMFRGKIKNKSELIKLLQQLGITIDK